MRSSLLERHLSLSTSRPVLTESQIQLDVLSAGLSDELNSPLNIAAMVAGGFVFRSSNFFLSRIASPLLTEGGLTTRVVTQVAIKGASLFSEVSVFRGISHRSLNIFQSKEFMTDALTFGTLKGFGRIAHGQNQIITHFFQASGMVAAQNAAAGLGIAAHPEGNLIQQFMRAEATNIKLGLAMSLVGTMAPGLSVLERNLDLQTSTIISKNEFSYARENLVALMRMNSVAFSKSKNVLDAIKLEARLKDFTLERLSVDPTSGPPYVLPPEVDPGRTIDMVQNGNRVRMNHRVFSPEELRDPKTKVMFATAPETDFTRSFELDGKMHRDLMFDVMGSMTGIANDTGRIIHSISPNYPLEFLKANLPPERVRFESPKDMEDFQRSFLEHRPEVLLLSGLNVNTRVLLQMALFARQHGVKEVWLGGDAAIAPYKIIDEAFDRAIWDSSGEEYLFHELVGDHFPGHRHPGVDQMRASVKWFIPNGENDIKELNFETLHMVLRMGCTQNCVYCAEGVKSERGKARPPTSWEEAKDLIDEAYEKGIRRVYFIDPDFGRLWKDELEGRVVAYLHEKGMRWSCLSNVVTLRKHGDYMMQHGLASVYLGIESLSPDHDSTESMVEIVNGKIKLKVLNRAWQDQQETVRQAIRLRDNAVMVFGLYILFNPGETLEGIREGVRRLSEIVPLSQISTNQPFPGTEEFVTAIQHGYIFNFDPDYVRYGQMVWAPNGQVFEPLLATREYVSSHRIVNPLDRSGGFFDTQRRFRERRR